MARLPSVFGRASSSRTASLFGRTSALERSWFFARVPFSGRSLFSGPVCRRSAGVCWRTSGSCGRASRACARTSGCCGRASGIVGRSSAFARASAVFGRASVVFGRGGAETEFSVVFWVRGASQKQHVAASALLTAPHCLQVVTTVSFLRCGRFPRARPAEREDLIAAGGSGHKERKCVVSAKYMARCRARGTNVS